MAQSRAAKTLNYFIQGIALAWDGFTPLLKLNIAVQNPSNEQFVIRSISGSAWLGDTNAGNFSMFQTVVIAPNAHSVVPIVVRLNASGIVSDLIRLIQKGGYQMDLRIKGFVNANGFVNELNLDYKVV